MKFDYFELVNTPLKVKLLYDMLKKNKQHKSYNIYLNNQSHMPKLNSKLLNLLLQSCDFINGSISKIDNVTIHKL